MKKFTHAWLAMMAMKRIEKADIPEKQKDDAVALIKWFKDYRDFVISGAWYPDSVIKDMGTSHIIKYTSDETSTDKSFRRMPETLQMYQHGLKSPRREIPFSIKGGNLCDRCEAFTESLIDSFKILYSEAQGSPITPSCNHIAMRFFILSHYIADAHMPLHCDARQFANENALHGFIEEEWDRQVRSSYSLDEPNNRFFYDPEGYPLKKEVSPLMQYVEDELVRRPFVWAWGPDAPTSKKSKYYGVPTCKNTWDYMSGISQNSYLLAYDLVPEIPGKASKQMTTADYKATDAYREHFEEYSRMILSDAVESIAKIWLHAWVRYRDWWRGCELAELKKKADDAEKMYKAAAKILTDAKAAIEPLQEKADKALADYNKKKDAYDKAVASASKSVASAETAMKTAKTKLDKANAALRENMDKIETARCEAASLSLEMTVRATEHQARVQEYAKYTDSHSGI